MLCIFLVLLKGGKPTDQFGCSVALSGGIAIIGAQQHDFGTQTDQGAAYVFVRNGGFWSLQQELFATTGATNHHLGSSVAISGDTIVLGSPGFDQVRGGAYVLKYSCDATLGDILTVSAASFNPENPIAPESIVAGFGPYLAPGTRTATTLPLPTRMVEGSVLVRDSAGIERLAPLFFISPEQINYQIPPGTASGQANMTVTSGDNIIAAGTALITSVAPSLFSANSNGQGVAAALTLRIRADGTELYEPVARFDTAQNRFIAVPIDLGPETDQVFLVLFGTGIRFRSSLTGVRLTIGGTNSEVLYAGEAPGFVGLDQVNSRLARSLVGRGEVEVMLSADGKAANTVRISIR